VTAFDIHAGRPADVTLWTPALDRHQAIFGHAPDLAAGDRGFSSARNEQAAIDRGVRRVVLPRQGTKSPARRAHEHQRWFRRGQRWRVGAKGASVCSNVGMVCAAVATMASTACTDGSGSASSLTI